RERAMQVPDRIAEAAPLRRHDLDKVAHRRRVDGAQELELTGGRHRGHAELSSLAARRRGVTRCAILRNAWAKLTSSGIACGALRLSASNCCSSRPSAVR